MWAARKPSTIMTARTLASLLALGSLPACSSRCATAPPPVIVITIDTLRADHVSFLGTGASTPHLDQLAREGASGVALSPVPRTTQSIGTIFTGLHPLRHGADGLGMRLPEQVTTLAERLRDQGYDTAAIVSNLVLRPGLGFEQGFRLYSNPEARWEANSAEAITAEALAYLRNQPAGKPFLLWAHYLDPHWPYNPAASGAVSVATRARLAAFERNEQSKGALAFNADQLLEPGDLAGARELYRREVEATDRAIGQLLAGIEQSGLAQRAIVLFTADHGESLGEHRYWFAHGQYLYDETLRVPWALRAPGRVAPGTSWHGLIDAADNLPTLLGLLGLQPPHDLDGVDLSPLLRHGGQLEAPRRDLIQLTDHVLIYREDPRRGPTGRAGRWWAVRDDPFVLLTIPRTDGGVDEELYELASDPAQLHDIARARPEVATRLRERLDQARRGRFASSALTGEPLVDPEHERRLESLGYAGAGAKHP